MDLLDQLGETFLNWEEMAKVVPSLLTVGLPNTLILALASGILGSLLGLLLALMGISRNPVARWAARIYTDLFRGLPAILVILVIGIGLSPLPGNSPVTGTPIRSGSWR
ncbi:octopine transport system permease protein OccM [Arthrobacter sp. Hiyo4]|nr:octopine transport system permease protein OccM [Arthrobacter sp. Hiyo4]